MSAPDRHQRLAALRSVLEEKFPGQAPSQAGRLRTGWEAIDQRGGLRRGALTEICGSTAGGQLFLDALLATALRERFFLGLIDATDAFEPADWSPAQLQRLLWVRAASATSALKAADILLRDGNLPLLVLDLQGLSWRQWRGIPASTWHRFHRVVETSAVVLTVLTPQPLVEGATTRIALKAQFSLSLLHLDRALLRGRLEAQIFERGAGLFGGDSPSPSWTGTTGAG